MEEKNQNRKHEIILDYFHWRVCNHWVSLFSRFMISKNSTSWIPHRARWQYNALKCINSGLLNPGLIGKAGRLYQKIQPPHDAKWFYKNFSLWPHSVIFSDEIFNTGDRRDSLLQFNQKVWQTNKYGPVHHPVSSPVVQAVSLPHLLWKRLASS